MPTLQVHLSALGRILILFQGMLPLAAVASHLRNPRSFARTISDQKILHGNSYLLSLAVMAVELAIVTLVVFVVFAPNGARYSTLVINFASLYGVALALYLLALRNRKFEGECGCGMLDRNLPIVRTTVLRALMLPIAGATALIGGHFGVRGTVAEMALSAFFAVLLCAATTALPIPWAVNLSRQRDLETEHEWRILSGQEGLAERLS